MPVPDQVVGHAGPLAQEEGVGTRGFDEDMVGIEHLDLLNGVAQLAAIPEALELWLELASHSLKVQLQIFRRGRPTVLPSGLGVEGEADPLVGESSLGSPQRYRLAVLILTHQA